MGWLEVLQGTPDLIISDVSIPLWDDWKLCESLIYSLRIRFNSTMGWLEDWRSKDNTFVWYSFNSTMGWLEAKRFGGFQRWSVRFNSTMGWLEEKNRWFHKVLPRVSIPLWDDWKHLLSLHISSGLPVSIPLWDDWKKNKVIIEKQPLKVSIPLWDDWKEIRGQKSNIFL